MTTQTADELIRENEELRRRLDEAEAAIQALKAGEVDAVVVENGGEQVYTLETADKPYQLLVAQVPHPAATLTADGMIIACNPRFAELLRRPPSSLDGKALRDLVVPDSRPFLQELLRAGLSGEVQGEITFLRGDGTPVPTHLGVSAHHEGALGSCLMVTDLTERRQYEELRRTQAALRESEERYRTLFESIDEGFCVIQMLFDECGRPSDYRFLETNPTFEHQTGLRDVHTKTMRQLVPAHEEYWFQIYGRVAVTGEPIRFQKRADALHRWYDVYAFRIGDPQERKVAVLFNDITERKRTEEALQASEARLANDLAAARRLQEISSRLIQEGDIGQLYDHILEAAIGIMRSDMASMQLLHPERNELELLAWKGFHPASATFWQWVRIDSECACGQALRAGRRVVVPDVERRPFRDGSTDQAEYRRSGIRGVQSTPLISRDGRLLGMISTHWRDPHEPDERDLRLLDLLARQAADLIERRRAERALQASETRLRAILDNMPAVVYLVDNQQRFTFINRRWKADFGLTNEEAAGRPVADFFPRDVAEQFAANNRRVLEARCPLEVEEVVPHADGMHTYISSKVPLFDSAGIPQAVCGISIDITERKRAVEALKEADRKKDAFLATLAHELRNPLAPIRNAIQILKTNGPPVPHLEAARGVIDRQVRIMSRLLEDLLDVSRISRNKLDLRTERVDLARVVEAALETSRPVIEAGGHSLTVTLPPEPVIVVADPVRLAQVFSNLLANAAKYTEDGGCIALAAERQGGELVVSVRDTGIGISPEMMPRLFDIFAQAPPALERAQGGLGIGLSLVKGLVELHGGTIAAHSEGTGRGSEFVVRLPIAPAEGRAAESAPPRSADKPPAAPKRRVLVVDDNEDSAETLTQLLTILGHEVGTAYDGEQAVAMAEAMRPEVVLLDIGMPKLNGYDACRRIREQSWGRGVLLVALTGWGQEEDRRRTEEAGFNYHIVKPVDPAVLTRMLSSLSQGPVTG